MQSILEGPEDALLIAGVRVHVLRCRLENEVGNLVWLKDGILIAKNWSTYLDNRFSIIVNSSMPITLNQENFLQESTMLGTTHLIK